MAKEAETSELEELQQLGVNLSSLKRDLAQLITYPSHGFYTKKVRGETRELNRAFIFLRERVNKRGNTKAVKAMGMLRNLMTDVLSEKKSPSDRLLKIDEVEMVWPTLELRLGKMEQLPKKLLVPNSVLQSPYGSDIKEAVLDFDNDCFASCLVLARRAYESALMDLYRRETGKEPIADQFCPHCKKLVHKGTPMGIVKLHNWAVDSGLVSPRLKNVGYVVTEMGAGAAHPEEEQGFKPSSETARLGAIATIALLGEVLAKLRVDRRKS